jgi:hypothetical protein
MPVRGCTVLQALAIVSTVAICRPIPLRGLRARFVRLFARSGRLSALRHGQGLKHDGSHHLHVSRLREIAMKLRESRSLTCSTRRPCSSFCISRCQAMPGGPLPGADGPAAVPAVPSRPRFLARRRLGLPAVVRNDQRTLRLRTSAKLCSVPADFLVSSRFVSPSQRRWQVPARTNRLPALVRTSIGFCRTLRLALTHALCVVSVTAATSAQRASTRARPSARPAPLPRTPTTRDCRSARRVPREPSRASRRSRPASPAGSDATRERRARARAVRLTT